MAATLRTRRTAPAVGSRPIENRSCKRSRWHVHSPFPSRAELQVKFGLPSTHTLRAATINVKPTAFSGPHGDTIVFETHGEKSFEVVAQFDAPA